MVRTEPPDGIVITFPVQYLVDLCETAFGSKWVHDALGVQLSLDKKALKGFKLLTREMDQIVSGGDDRYWINSMSTKPSLQFEYVYITVLGSIRWRGNLLGFEPGGLRKFDNGLSRHANHWMLIGNIIKAPGEFPFEGCQGFRYTQKLF